MPQNDESSRRSFLKTAATTGAALVATPLMGCATGDRKSADSKPAGPENASGYKPGPEPKKRDSYKDLRIAFIGTGGMGGSHVEEMGKLGVSCLCYADVDTTHHERAAKQYPNAKGYQDYREMLDKEHKNIDGVMIGIPDHSHYPATMMAMQLGKHVYTQKPLTHTPWEARQLTLAAKKYKLATQMGNQGHANEGWRLLYEWIHQGAIGTVKEVHTWTDRPIWPQGMDRPKGEDGKELSDSVPSHVNWDLWLGPAPLRPFKEKVYHPFAWRGWWDFGAGALGDMACHTMDGLFFALQPDAPISVEPVAATPVNGESFPKQSVVKWRYPGKGMIANGFDSYWYDGGLLPKCPDYLEAGRHLKGTGSLFIGSKGAILAGGDYGDSVRVVPETRMKEIGKPKRMLDRSPGHYVEWVMACVGDAPLDFPKSNFAYAGPMTEAILLGNIALRMERKLEWDSKAFKFTNVKEANQYVTKEYRKGWEYKLA